MKSQTTINKVLIAPGDTVTVHCQNGQSMFDVMKTELIFNYGGDLKIVGCNAEETYVILQQQFGDLHDWRTSVIGERNLDFKSADNANWSKFYNFQQTDAYKKWINTSLDEDGYTWEK